MLPHCSIIVPTWERPAQLPDTLQSFAALDYPKDRFEVVVVDDGGRAPLDCVVRPYAGAMSLKLVRQSNAGPGGARNTGVQHARGDLLAFTDDDCRVEPGWLRALADAFARHPDRMIGGRTVNEAPELCSTVSQLIVDVVYRYYNADPADARFVASNNMALSADAFRNAGGFDPSFRWSEDRDFCDRWRHRGGRIIYVPAATIRHFHVLDLAGFCRQHFQYGRGAERFSRRRASRGSGTMLTDMRFHLQVMNWLGYPLRQVPRRQVPKAAGLLALWQAANAAGFGYERIRRVGQGVTR